MDPAGSSPDAIFFRISSVTRYTVAAWVGDSVEELGRPYSHLLKDHADTHGAVLAGLMARPKLLRVRNAA
ncbi:hypothetical protein ACFPH6_01155 [Streptomyces xiangluensis]|uniref:Uncharacterized protein n=1 Tax=Streptomyces xiangluensis TaxID=2665720 RepID=A0ABV8YD02_9ACTN